MGLPEVFPQLGVGIDGALNEIGKIGGKQGEPKEVPLGLCLTPVHIDAVAHGLEQVERHTQRQPQAEKGEACPLRRRCRAGKQQHLAEKEHGKVQHQAHRQGDPVAVLHPGPEAFLFLPGKALVFRQMPFLGFQPAVHAADGYVGAHHRHQQEDGIAQIRRQVENSAEDKQQRPLAALWQKIVCRRKDKEEQNKRK